jgi:short-subunit dehydrogenase
VRHLANRSAIVTGASRGVGPYICRRLAREKMNLVLVARSAAMLETTAAELRGCGVKALVVPIDLANREDLMALVDAAVQEFGVVDVLVNCAGIANVFSYHKLHADNIERVIQVNLIAPMILTRMLLPGMLERGRGHIVNISSIAGRASPPYGEAYGASKAGLIGFTESLRAEYRGTGVSASVILPGFVRGAGMYQDSKEKTGVMAARWLGGCSPESVARAVLKAIQKDRAEVIVNIPPMRPLAVLLQISPWLREWVLRSIGYPTAFARTAEANEHIGGEVKGATPLWER